MRGCENWGGQSEETFSTSERGSTIKSNGSITKNTMVHEMRERNKKKSRG